MTGQQIGRSCEFFFRNIRVQVDGNQFLGTIAIFSLNKNVQPVLQKGSALFHLVGTLKRQINSLLYINTKLFLKT